MLALNDLVISNELDSKAMGEVLGGYSVYRTTGWQYTHTGSKIYGKWRRKYVFFGPWIRNWKQYRYAKRTQFGKELAATGTQYA